MTERELKLAIFKQRPDLRFARVAKDAYIVADDDSVTFAIITPEMMARRAEFGYPNVVVDDAFIPAARKIIRPLVANEQAPGSKLIFVEEC